LTIVVARTIDRADLDGRLRLVASPDAADQSVTIHTDARLHAGRFDAGATGELPLPAGRHAWVQVARGRARINGHDLGAGDGASLSDVPGVQAEGLDASEILVFDLA
jgi:redox-sensitive bicupin YhaK (pirin superfamily)